MATTTLTPNIWITTAPSSEISTTQITNSQNYTSVEIETQKIEDSVTKEPILLNIPIQFRNQPRNSGTGDPDLNTLCLDLLSQKRTITITGVLSENSTTTAKSKMDDLQTIFKRGGWFSVVWGSSTEQKKIAYSSDGSTPGVNVTRYTFRETNKPNVDHGDYPTSVPTRGIDVEINLIVCKDQAETV